MYAGSGSTDGAPRYTFTFSAKPVTRMKDCLPASSSMCTSPSYSPDSSGRKTTSTCALELTAA